MKKKTYIISLFTSIAIIALVYVGTYQYAISDIGKDSVEENNTDENNKNVTNRDVTNKDVDSKESESKYVDNDSNKITSETKYVLESYDANKYTLKEEKQTMPVDLIGMSREDLIEYISNYETNPTLTDIENGFVYIELVSFSKDLVTIRKTYKLDDNSYKYCLVVENGYITVYYLDMKTVYSYTDIALASLPEDVQQEVIDGKQIASLQDLYNFLETYSS